MPTQISDPVRAAKAAKNAAFAAGFDAVGIADATAPWPFGARLAEFVALGRHGSMGWMEETLERRAHPTAMWGEARAAIVVGMNYGPDHNPLDTLTKHENAAISVYAQGDDYHDVVKKALKVLAGQVARYTGADVKVFVDTAPLMEKPLAARAGLGWQGKHTNLVSRTQGSWLFLGVVLCAAEMAADEAEVDHCGSCQACLDICPTKAFPAPYQLDARRCISYLTIEHPGPIPREFRAAMGNRIYGCDDCLAVCPWNKFASVASEARLQAREGLRCPALVDLAGLDDAEFRVLFAKNPIKRIGRNRFVRNVAIALGNSGALASATPLDRLADDGSPLVRGASAWGLSRLLPKGDYRARASHALESEVDATVRAEWEAGCE
jgi:epoxyqueuosine reductase